VKRYTRNFDKWSFLFYPSSSPPRASLTYRL
jgi:hypothetical protein